MTNCQPGSRFFGAMSHFINDNSLIIADLQHLSSQNPFSYCNSSVSRTDHILCSSYVNDLIYTVEVLYEYVTSDHKPIAATLSIVPYVCNNVGQ